MSRFINPELKSDSDYEPDLEVESKSDAELMAKLNRFGISHFANFGQFIKISYFAEFGQVKK